MHRFTRRAAAVALSAALVTIGWGATQGPAGADSGDQPTVLRVGVPNDLTTANPMFLRSNSDWNVATIQYDMMLDFGDKDLSAAPGLAQSCKPNDDLTVWTCTIRDDVKWSDGTPLTSKDIAFTYNLIMKQGISIYDSYFSDNPTFKTPNDTTLIWKSPKPTNAPLTPPWVYIVPEHIWGKFLNADKEELKAFENVPSVTTGPYFLSDVKSGQGWTLERNPYYWGDQPYYDQIQFRVYANQDTMALALENGEIDVATYFETALLPSLDSNPDITVQRNVSDWWLNLAFNFGGQSPDADPLPALQDKTLRTAIAMAIDKQGIIDKAYNGAGTPGTSAIHEVPEFWHYDVPEADQIPFDPDQANQLLDDAGYKQNSDGIRVDPATGDVLKLRMPISQETPGAFTAGQLIQGYLKAIGVDVELLPVNEGKMYSYWETGNWDAYIWYWTGEPDPNYQLSAFTTGMCKNLSDGCWSNAKYDAMFEKQGGMVDPDARQKVVFAMEKLIYQETPSIALAYPNNIEAYRNDLVTDFTPVPGPNGYLIPNYNNKSMVTVHPVSGAQSASTAAGLPVWGWGLVFVAVPMWSVWLYRRGDRHDEEEGWAA